MAHGASSFANREREVNPNAEAGGAHRRAGGTHRRGTALRRAVGGLQGDERVLGRRGCISKKRFGQGNGQVRGVVHRAWAANGDDEQTSRQEALRGVRWAIFRACGWRRIESIWCGCSYKRCNVQNIQSLGGGDKMWPR